MKVLTVTGYKPIELNIFKPNDHRIVFIKEAIKKRLISYIEEEGLEWVILSGQMGVELWTSQVVLDLKESYEINLGVIPPFQEQEGRWPEQYQNDYQEIVMLADFHQTIYDDTYKGPYQFKARDKWLIEKSDACLILLDEEHPSSTRFFLDEAQKAYNNNAYPIYTITPFDLEEVVMQMQDEISDWNQD
ncbi:SLOG family protein [Radiobacillus sp. PE A8.2]|uniref:SLOG family protein n=1 Tax=Radiobacillus sp. PE A8.2 TaxID=3380349 RepID=UPI00388E51CC